jgi:hypothetical protein
MTRVEAVLVILFLATPAVAQNPAVMQSVPRQVPRELVTGRPGVPTPPPPPPTRIAPSQEHAPAQPGAAIGDMAGGRFIPKPILDILADPRIDPDIAYIFWQTSRKPLDDWTMAELRFIAQAAPTLVEAGIPVAKIRMLYQFWGLDPNDVFNPSLSADWQEQSTAFDPRSSGNVGAISSADCQVDLNLMTVGTYRACLRGGQ